MDLAGQYQKDFGAVIGETITFRKPIYLAGADEAAENLQRVLRTYAPLLGKNLDIPGDRECDFALSEGL